MPNRAAYYMDSTSPSFGILDSSEEKSFVPSPMALTAALTKSQAEETKPKPVSELFAPDFSEVRDPFNVLDSNEILPTPLLRRIEAGRKSGKLNICASGLKTLPNAVYDKYLSDNDPDLSFGTPPRWSENVDMERILAADNEIEKLEDRFVKNFPNLALLDVRVLLL